MDNIYPDTIQTILVHPSQRKIVVELLKKADDVCRYSISSKYIRTALNSFKRGYYYTDNENKIIGLCIWKEYKDIQKDGTILKKVHITLICADYNNYNLGRKIMYDVELYCIDNNFSLITLEAANNDLIVYYEKGGFTLIDKDYRIMKKPVKLIIIHRKNNKTRKIKSSVINSTNLEEI